MAKPPATLAEVRDAIEALRDEVGELGGELLHRSDADRRCLRIIVTKVSHLHNDMARRRRRK